MDNADSKSAVLPPLPGGAIRSAREGLLLSQDQLAKASGVSVSTIARMEKGSPVSPESLKAVCAVIGLDAVSMRRMASASPGPAKTEDAETGNGADRQPEWPSPNAVFRHRRSLRDLALFVPFALVAFSLCVFGAEMGTQTSNLALVERRADFDESLLYIAVLKSSAQVNQASRLYSSALPPDPAATDWQPWKGTKPLTWLNCTTSSYVGWYLGYLLSRDQEDPVHCRDKGLVMRMTRRDAERTDFVVGPSTNKELERFLSMLTADPTVSVQAFTSPLGDVPTDGAGWRDPRADGYRGGMADGKGWHVHLRLSRAAL